MWNSLLNLLLRLLAGILVKWLGRLGKWLLLVIYKWLKNVLKVVRYLARR